MCKLKRARWVGGIQRKGVPFVRVDALLSAGSDPSAEAARLESLGYDTVRVPEAGSDPFVNSAVAATATRRVRLGTGVAVAFGRTPLTVAQSGYDLAQVAGGRFVLGLGSQVRAHIERRYSMPWSHPIERMREFVQAVRAIWCNWTTGAPLQFRGRFYRHELMTPAFVPPRHEYPPPEIYLAGVSTRMTELAGELADGYVFHPFTSEHYLRSVTLPALARGAARRSGSHPVPVVGSLMVCVAPPGRAKPDQAAIGVTRRSIAFYASTAAYQPLLDAHGLAELRPRLSELARAGRWDDMAALVPGNFVREVAVIGTPEEVAQGVLRRCRGVVRSVALHAPAGLNEQAEAETVAALRGS